MNPIPPEAIQAAAKFLPGIPEDAQEEALRENTTRAMLIAAMPAIRKHFVDEIEAYLLFNRRNLDPFSEGWDAALTRAAQIMKGEGA